jgi:hypothetical protein
VSQFRDRLIAAVIGRRAVIANVDFIRPVRVSDKTPPVLHVNVRMSGTGNKRNDLKGGNETGETSSTGRR